MVNKLAKQPEAQNPVVLLSEYMAQRKSQLAAVLPKHVTPERLMKIACAAVSRSPILVQCTVPSLYMAISQAAQLGLEIDLSGSAYLVPFKNNKTGRFEAILIPGYRGLVELARRSGEVTQIRAHVVHDGDQFTYELGLEPKLIHKPVLGTPGEMSHVYAVAHLKDGDKQFVVLDRDEVHKIRMSSKAAQSGPWVQWPEEMAKKTAVRRLCKYLPMSVEIRQAIQIEESAESGDQPMVGLAGEDVFKIDIDVLDQTAGTDGLKNRLKQNGTPATVEDPGDDDKPPVDCGPGEFSQPDVGDLPAPIFCIQAVGPDAYEQKEALMESGYAWAEKIEGKGKALTLKNLNQADVQMHIDALLDINPAIIRKAYNTETGECIFNSHT